MGSLKCCYNKAAEHTGQIRAELDKIGKPISSYDPIIAGHARINALIIWKNSSE